MKIKTKIFLVLLAVILCVIGLVGGIQRFIIYPSFIKIEKNEAIANMQRCQKAILREIHHLKLLSNDWGAWDDTYNFVDDRNPDYIESNLVIETFTGNDLNMLLISNSLGRIIWSRVVDLDTEQQLFLKDFSGDHIPANSPLVKHTDLRDIISGLYMTEKGPMIVASCPILTSTNDGPIRGSLIMGKFINEGFIDKIASQELVNLQMWPIDSDTVQQHDRDMYHDLISQKKPFHVYYPNDSTMQVYATLPDITGKAILLLRATSPREISSAGTSTIKFAFMSTLVIGAITLLILLIVLQKIIVNPLAVLAENMISIRKSGDLTKSQLADRSDEIGDLSSEFNYMLQQIQDARAHLEQRVADRTESLNQANIKLTNEIKERIMAEEEKSKLEACLQQAYKMEAIGTLAGGIAHDFNNILSAIIGFTELAKDSAPDQGQLQDDLNQVLSSANRAKELVEQILVFSRHEEKDKRPLRIQQIIKEVLGLLRASIPASIEIQLHIDQDCGTVLADSTQMHQVLMNLCSNAVQAMDEKGVLEISLQEREFNEVEIGSLPNLKLGRHIKLTISDTGRGMDKTTTEKIFDPFFTTKEVGEGTGMGLSVVHGIVQSHQGMITVESELGKGTTFHVYFPAWHNEISLDSEDSLGIPRGDERILFVDDEEVITRSGQRVLGRLGYQVTVFTDSAEALEKFKATPDEFDLVITDQAMPKMTGIELTRELLNIRPDIAIILCTGYSRKITEENIKDLGIKGVATKPMDMKKYAEIARMALGEKRLMQMQV
jgi:signal transduction histidine kinase/ActR/RegA family two-component response regulator